MAMIAGVSSTEYHRNYYYKRRARLIAVLGDRCVSCGSMHDLQFDHVDPSLKSFDIKDNMTASNPAVLAELAKCQLLCANCHLQKTARENSGYTHGTWYGFMNMKCVCPKCSARREAFNRQRREARSRTGQRGPYGRPSRHGEQLHYRRGCRCDECRASNTNAEKARRRNLASKDVDPNPV